MMSDKKKEKCEILNQNLTELGFHLKNYEGCFYQLLISPFSDDQNKPHPFKTIIPKSYSSLKFDVDKLDFNKLNEQTLIYIFYNIMDQKMQLTAAEHLIAKKVYYLRSQRIWLKDAGEGKYNYWNLDAWKFTEYKAEVRNQDFVTLKQFQESLPPVAVSKPTA